MVPGPKGGSYFWGGGFTFGSVGFAATLPFPTQKMSQPVLFDNLQLEENDTIDKSLEDSDLVVVEAPVNDEEPEEPEEPPSVMEVLLNIDEDTTENVARAGNNGAKAPKVQTTPEERVQAIEEKCAQISETAIAARRNRADLLTQASYVYHFENKSKKATALAFGFLKLLVQNKCMHTVRFEEIGDHGFVDPNAVQEQIPPQPEASTC